MSDSKSEKFSSKDARGLELSLGKSAERLLLTSTIREQAEKIFSLADAGKTNFRLNLDQLDSTAEFVAQVTRQRYPDLKIPFHSRWSHFQVGSIDRVAELEKLLHGLSAEDRVRSKIDLVIVSVLLDAGAGHLWKFTEKLTEKSTEKLTETQSTQFFSRSEGLAVASFRAFLSGLFSSNPESPFEVDSEALQQLSENDLRKAFQVSPQNPIDGFSGRWQLLRDLGYRLQASPPFFGLAPRRPGGLLNYWAEIAKGSKLRATQILRGLQLSLGPIWPGRVQREGLNLGDVWSYPPLGSGDEGLVPFHKLSQWLTYSLVDPLVEYGFEITDFDELTGLAEYRNGGLLLDKGVLELHNPILADRAHSAGSELIVEWRALTVALLDRLAERVRIQLGLAVEQLPLGKMLEGGTWAAGRQIAAEKRPRTGAPPLLLESDGTVF